MTSDGRGAGPAWHLDSVEVVNTVRSTSVVFPCARWLDGKADPMSLTQTLLPRGADGSSPELLAYEVVVYTSDVKNAGTDANVAIEIVGDKVRRCWRYRSCGTQRIASTIQRCRSPSVHTQIFTLCLHRPLYNNSIVSPYHDWHVHINEPQVACQHVSSSNPPPCCTPAGPHGAHPAVLQAQRL